MKFVRGALPGLPGLHDIAVIEGDDHIGKWVEERGRLDHDASLPYIAEFIAPESVVYDVGANIGDHAAYYASLRPRAVVAFEAYQDAFACLTRNMASYRESVSVALFWAAVGAGEWVECADAEANKGARRVVVSGAPRLAIPTLTLDQLPWTDNPPLPPTLIKLDIEGWEVKALRGAACTLHEHRPIIVCEVNRGALEAAGDSPEALHALLTSHGYEMREIFSNETWLPGDERPQFDVVARPR